MTVTVYRSDDASAPVLSGTAGALIALLDACLVNGYGAKAAAGWTKAFTGTNQAAYRMPTGSNLHYLAVDDTTTTYATLRGYEAMTAVATGTGPFPTTAQLLTSDVCKSSAADTTARSWVLATNGTMVYLHVSTTVVTDGSTAAMVGFGQIVSNKVGDMYGTILVSNTGATYSTNSMQAAIASVLGATSAGHYLARSYTQVGGSVQCAKGIDPFLCAGGTVIGSSGMTYPMPVDGGLYMSPVRLSEASLFRGVIPGLWAPAHNKPLLHLDTVSGSGASSGKTFLALNMYSAAQVLVETSNTW
jgi:hypothetical protein